MTLIFNPTTGKLDWTIRESDFVRLAGRSGGQTINGGTGASQNLVLQSTNHATKGLITSDSTFKLLQVGADATGYADQRNSNVLSFEGSNWNGSTEEKSTWSFVLGQASTAAYRPTLYLKKGTANIVEYSSATINGSNAIYTNIFTRTQYSTATANTVSASVHAVKNTNTTVNNAQAFQAQNAGDMVAGALLFRNVNHSATVGIANLEFWLANGAAATNVMTLLSTGLLGIGTSAPTHTLTFPSTSTGIALYNTADQTTNLERLQIYWGANIAKIETTNGGTGTVRAIRISSHGQLNMYGSGTVGGAININDSTSGANCGVLEIAGTMTASSGVNTGLYVHPTYNASGTQGYTALKINAVETAVGSGVKRLIEAQVGGVDKFFVDNAGKATAIGATIGDATNNATFDASGKLTLNGTATVWNDQFVDGLSLRGGASAPAFSLFQGGVYAVNFVDGQTDEVHGSLELQHDYKEGSDLEVHLHWSPSTTNVGNCRWNFEYTVANQITGTFGATTTLTVDAPSGGTAFKHVYLTMGAIAGAGRLIGDVIMFRLYRAGTHANDTFTGNAFLLRVALHYECDKLGSDT